MKKFKLIKETKFKKALGKLEGFISRNKRKLQLALPTLGLATIFLTPGTALADEAVTADVENVNEGVTPIEQATTLAAPETALADELANAGVTINDETSVVEETTVVEETPVVEETATVEETPVVEETTVEEVEEATVEETKAEEKEGFLEIIDAESHKSPESVDLPVAGENKNPMGFVVNEDGSAMAIFSPVEAMSYDEVHELVDNLRNSNVSSTKIVKDVIIKMLINNPDINEPVVYDMSKYGLGNIMVSKNDDGTYKMSFDGSDDIEAITASVTNDKNHSLDPDTTPVYKGAPENPTPENPTPENPTPENPTPENPTSENPAPEPSNDLPPKTGDLAQTGDENSLAMLIAMGGLAGAAGTTMRSARRRAR